MGGCIQCTYLNYSYYFHVVEPEQNTHTQNEKWNKIEKKKQIEKSVIKAHQGSQKWEWTKGKKLIKN